MKEIFLKIYEEDNKGTNLSLFIASLTALLFYFLINNVSVIALGLIFIAFFSVSKIIFGIIFTEEDREKEILNKFSEEEKRVIDFYISKGVAFITFSELNNSDFENTAFESLKNRGIIKRMEWGPGDGPSGFQLNEEVYKFFLKGKN